jgi:hypothetical protein
MIDAAREGKVWTMLRPAALPLALPAAFLQLTHGRAN